MYRRRTTASLSRPLSLLAQHRVHELSDIREVSGSSKGKVLEDYEKTHMSTTRDTLDTPTKENQRHYVAETPDFVTPDHQRASNGQGLGSRAASTLSLPLRDIPERRSSASMFAQSLGGSRVGSLQEFPPTKITSMQSIEQSLQSQGRSESPVKHAVERSAISSGMFRISPSKTIVRTSPPLELLDGGSSQHPRVDMCMHLPSPLFVGGGTIEGQLVLGIDHGKNKVKSKPIYLSRLAVDVMGIEEVGDEKRWVFLSLATELVDIKHPPPSSIVAAQTPIDSTELLWQLKPGSATIPFCINLPLKLGPPPYLSKQACIRYVLCPSAHFRAANKRTMLRQVWSVQMLTVHDPEKALGSLPSPLLATDTITVSSHPEIQTVKVTAGLHRQTWVNGGALFVDVHIVNSTSRTLRRIDVHLEKTTLWYSHSAAGTIEKSANYLRLPKRNESETVASSTVKKSEKWKGVNARSSDARTIELQIPRGHVTIGNGRFFEIRYFLNVTVAVTLFKTLTVQLPITLIHMNSLDILPNSLSQVAKSIEAKQLRDFAAGPRNSRSGTLYQSGQAFNAPRRQSLERMRREQSQASNDDIHCLTTDIDKSPRRFRSHRHAHSSAGMLVRQRSTSSSAGPPPPLHDRSTIQANCQHLLHNIDGSYTPPGPRLPRLQASTSGLGFSESEFELPPDSPPRKVMLSEMERKLIKQQAELRLQREWSRKRRGQSLDRKAKEENKNAPAEAQFVGWKNVALPDNNVPPTTQPFTNTTNTHYAAMMNLDGVLKENLSKQSGKVRSKSGATKSVPSLRPSRHGARSVDQLLRHSLADNDSIQFGRGRRASQDRVIRRSMDRLYG